MVTKPDHFLCLLKELLESRTVCPEREKPHDIAVHSNRDLQVLQYLCVNSRIPVLSNFHSSFVHSRGHPFIPFHYSLKTAESAVQKLLQLQAVRVAFLPQWPLHWSEVMETGLLTLERLDRQQLESQFPARVEMEDLFHGSPRIRCTSWHATPIPTPVWLVSDPVWEASRGTAGARGGRG